MFDIKKVEAEALKEISDEQAETARRRIKAKLKEIAAAERIVLNLRGEYAVLLRDIG